MIIFKIKNDYLSDCNIKLIKFVKKIKIYNEFLYSSKFNFSKKNKKLINILEKLNVKNIYRRFSKRLFNKDKFENLTDIKLSFNEFQNKKI